MYILVSNIEVSVCASDGKYPQNISRKFAN